jgi:nucleoid DNA-binding protein/PHD/YefM family antitoxin component YafN of YafNO toxin-antitoxin module
MQKTDKYISELLYNHDCVIIPGFGGFIGNYSPAKINTTQHVFTPPHKHIVFNINLKNNDGLLANCIASSENINYTEALSSIDKYVFQLNDSLKKGEKVKVDTVGTLFLNEAKTIQFNPSSTNFLIDSFGLSEFVAPAVKQEKISKRIEKSITTDTVKVVNFQEAAVSKRKINYTKVVSIAASFIIVVGLLWISLKTDFVQHINYANLNPFVNQHKKTDTIIIHTQAEENNDFAPATEEPLIENTTTSAETSDAITAVIPEAVKPDSLLVALSYKQPVDMRYHIVTGCFQIEDNAKKFVETLSSQHIESAIIGKNNSDLYIVSSGDYTSYKQAIEALRSIQASQPSAWLYKSN